VLKTRKKLYKNAADLTINTTNKKIAEIVEEIFIYIKLKEFDLNFK
jgi:hypothetical protein